jgi:NAD+ kinase
VEIEVLSPERRPVAAVADHIEVRGVHAVEVHMDSGIATNLLFDPGHSLEERILREQFGY